MEFKKRPTINSNYTKQDLRDYALYRKNEELKDITKLLNKYKNKKNKDFTDDEDYREPLSVEEKIYLKITLSWGGDGDGFILQIDRDTGDVISGVYYWEDWGVYEEVNLTDEELEVVEEYFNPSINYYLYY